MRAPGATAARNSALPTLLPDADATWFDGIEAIWLGIGAIGNCFGIGAIGNWLDVGTIGNWLGIGAIGNWLGIVAIWLSIGAIGPASGESLLTGGGGAETRCCGTCGTKQVITMTCFFLQKKQVVDWPR